jgi:formate/nitrite transporter FocA (FNT family)
MEMRMGAPERDRRSAVDVTTPAHEALARDTPQEEAQKSYHTVLEQHIQQAQEDIERPAGGLLLSSFSAGLDIGFGPFLMAVTATLVHGAFARPITELLMALAYTSGFVLVIVGRSALFTEQTTSAVLPVLAQRVPAWRLLRLWSLVLAGNLAAGALIALFIPYLGQRLGIIEVSALAAIADKLVRHASSVVFLSAIAAGWLMGLLAWLVVASRETMSQIVIVVLVTFIIGIAGLHHSIAGAVEVLMAVFANTGVTLREYARVVSLSIVGNALGGVVFVALLKFGHVRASLRRSG